MGVTAVGSVLILFCGAVLGAPTTTKPIGSCTACPPGLGVAKRCTTGQDTICVPCPVGTYSKMLSTLESCNACSRCGEHLFELHPCSATSDVFCELCSRSKAIPNTDYHKKCLSGDNVVPSDGSQIKPTENKINTEPSTRRRNYSKQMKDASHLGFFLRVGGIDPPKAPEIDSKNNTLNDIKKNATEKSIAGPVSVPTNQSDPIKNVPIDNANKISSTMNKTDPEKEVSTDTKSGINTNKTLEGGDRNKTMDKPTDVQVVTTVTPAVTNDTITVEAPSKSEKSNPDLKLKSNATTIATVQPGLEKNQTTTSGTIEIGNTSIKTELEKNQTVVSGDIETGPNTTVPTRPTTVTKGYITTNLSSPDIPVVPVLDRKSTHVVRTVNTTVRTTTAPPTTKIAFKVKTTVKVSVKPSPTKLTPTPKIRHKPTIAVQRKTTYFKSKIPKTTRSVNGSGLLFPGTNDDVKVGAVTNTGSTSSTFAIVAAALTAAIVFFAIGFFVNRFGTRKGIFRPSGSMRTHRHVSENNYQETALTRPPVGNHVRVPTPEEAEAPADPGKEEEEPLTVADKDPAGPPAGSSQSPVDINPEDAEIDESMEKSPLFIKYTGEYTSTITNTGNTVRIDMNGHSCELSEGPLLYKFQLNHIVFHWGSNSYNGSEHTVNGVPFAGEIQLVHWNPEEYPSYEVAEKSEDGLAIMSVFMQVGNEDHEGLKRLTDCLPSIQYQEESREPPSNLFDPSTLLPENTTDYWCYQGSITVEPFSESVTWIIFKDPLMVSEEQMEEFRRLVYHKKDEKYLLSAPDDAFIVDNFRQVQPLGDRPIYASFA